jgi:hypothetical protein
VKTPELRLSLPARGGGPFPAPFVGPPAGPFLALYLGYSYQRSSNSVLDLALCLLANTKDTNNVLHVANADLLLGAWSVDVCSASGCRCVHLGTGVCQRFMFVSLGDGLALG